ncbi:transcription factor SPT20 homolog [Bicyclus anynana]|uniref:Transcription factor SPT20 homolog n=1 Tax=Bicyclus anynana TaxID=110368 RepID=A0A6J1N782_BICAN|nr:transcription factor SPT20 homolog [Bicyclus anynana]
MKELLTLVSLVLSGVVAQAPYPPSGWRPDGPAFVTPERTQFVSPQQQYLPPVDPRRPLTPNGFDEGDVSVQGLPIIEPQQIFEVSPINGQQYTGPSINADIQRLNPSFQQAQYQQQQEKALQFARQREFENNRARFPSSTLPNQQSPRQFASPPTTTTTTTAKPELKTPQAETTTESINLNEGETLDDNTKEQKDKVSVEVTKQNIQEYPPEIFLNPFAQLKLQQQFVPFGPQFGQLRAPLFYQPAQLQDGRTGFDGPAHLSALPSVLAQRELLSQQAQGQGFAQNPIIVQQQPGFIQEPVNKFQPMPPIQRAQQPVQPVDPEQNEEPDQDDERDVEPLQPTQPSQDYPQIQAQPVILQQQPINQIQPNQFQQPQLQYQPQPQLQFQSQPVQFAQPQYQPQPQLPVQPQVIQPSQFPQPQLQYQPQPQLIQPQQAQPNPYPQPQLQFQPQPAQPNQFPQPQLQFQPQPAQPNQFLQPQRPKDVEEIEPTDQQVVYQNYQPQFYQPQFQGNQYQTPEQPLFVGQPQQTFAYQNQEQFYQNQFPQQQYDPNQAQPQDGQPLQSGLDINQQGNDIDQQEEQENEQEEEGPKVTAVATAFGTRTQPRVFAKYGAPIPKVQQSPGYETTTEQAQEEPQEEDAPAVAQATAVASGRRNAKLRSRRVRPIFTLDRSGHLVLAQQQ